MVNNNYNYKRSIGYARKYYKTKYGKRNAGRWNIYGRAGKQLAKDVWTLKNLINVEFKSSDIYNSTQTAPLAGALVLVNHLTKGDDYNNRDGRQVRFKSLFLNGRVIMHASATHTAVRMVVFIDKQPNGVVPTATDVLSTATTNLIDAFRNLNNRKRFVILKDARYTLNTDYPEKQIKYYKKLDMKTIYDDGDAGTIADITTNALYVMWISDEGTWVPDVRVPARLRFIDN